jgi:hypothetical protein
MLAVSTKGKLGIRKTFFLELPSSGTTSSRLVIIYRLFKELDAPFFMVDHEDYTESGVRNLLRNTGNYLPNNKVPYSTRMQIFIINAGKTSKPHKLFVVFQSSLN